MPRVSSERHRAMFAGGGPQTARMRWIWSTGSSPANKGWPTCISTSTHARLHMSMAPVSGCTSDGGGGGVGVVLGPPPAHLEEDVEEDNDEQGNEEERCWKVADDRAGCCKCRVVALGGCSG